MLVNNLAKAMGDRAYSVPALSESSGVSIATIYRILRGDDSNCVHQDTALCLAKALGTTVGALFPMVRYLTLLGASPLNQRTTRHSDADDSTGELCFGCFVVKARNGKCNCD